MANEYLIPLGADLGPLIQDIREARGEIGKLGDAAEASATNMKTAFTDASKSGSLLAKSTVESAKAVTELAKDFNVLSGSIDGYTTNLKEVAVTQSALNKELEKAITTSEKQLAGLKEGSKEYKRLSKEIEAAKIGYNQLNGVVDQQGAKMEKLKKTYRENVSVLQSLAAQGLQNTKVYKELEKATGQIDDNIRDVNEAVKLAGSDTKGLDNLIGSAQTLTGAFAVAQGAVAIFGKENENFEKALLKVNAALSILNGLQAIQSELKRKDSIVSRVAAASQALYGTVVGASTGALKAFRIALAATGIGLIVVAVGYLIANFDELKKKVLDLFPGLGTLSNFIGGLVEDFTDFVGITSQADRNLSALKKSTDRYNEAIDQTIAVLEARGGKEELIFRLSKVRIEKELNLLRETLKTKGELTDEEAKQFRDLNNQLKVLDAQKEKRTEDQAKESAEKQEQRNKAAQAKQKEAAEKLAAIDKDQREKLLAFDKQFRDLKIDAINDEYQKSVAIEKAKFADLADQANKQVEAFKGTDSQRAKLQAAADQVIEQAKDIHFKELIRLEKEYFDQRAEVVKNANDLADQVLLSEDENARKTIEKKYDQTIKDLKKRVRDSLGADDEAKEALSRILDAQNQEIQDSDNDFMNQRAEKRREANEKEEKEFVEFFARLENIGTDYLQKAGLSESESQAVVDSFKKTFGQITDNYLANIDLQIEGKDKQIEALTAQIDEAEEQLSREQELQKNGYANNVKNKEQEIERLKAARKKEAEDQKKLAIERAKIQSIEIAQSTISQTVTLGEAAAKIFKATAGIPFVGVALALAAVGTMFAGFLSIKSRIKAAQDAAPKFRKGGSLELDGPSHEAGGIALVNESTGKKIAEFEGKEHLFAVNKGSGQKHKSLLQAINEDDFSGIDSNHGSIRQLLKEVGGVHMIEDKPASVVKIQRKAAAGKIDQLAKLSGLASDAKLQDLLIELEGFRKQEKERPIVIPFHDHVEVREGNRVSRYFKKKDNDKSV